MVADIMATEATEKHGKKQYPLLNTFFVLPWIRGY
jgi:hypothetical protein